MLRQELSRADLPAIFAPNQLVLRFISAYNRQYEACSDPIRIARVEENLARITGQGWKIRCELRDLPSDAAQKPDESLPPPREPSSEPLIDKAQTSLGARLLRVDDGFGETRSESPTAAEDEGNWSDPEEV